MAERLEWLCVACFPPGSHPLPRPGQKMCLVSWGSSGSDGGGGLVGGCLLRSQELLESCTICRQWEWPPNPRCWEGIFVQSDGGGLTDPSEICLLSPSL